MSDYCSVFGCFEWVWRGLDEGGKRIKAEIAVKNSLAPSGARQYHSILIFHLRVKLSVPDVLDRQISVPKGW